MRQAAWTIDWDAIDLLVFDVDGTLYDQARLRRRMLVELAANCCRERSVATLLVLSVFRRCREELSRVRQAEDFTELQYRMTAERCNLHPDEVRLRVKVWIEDRPVRFLRRYRFDGVAEIFEACARRGKAVAVWSDYPAAAKLAALELTAGIVVSSDDESVRRLKPDPAALHQILSRTGIPAHRAMLIGDRAEHDGEAARRAGVRALLKGTAPRREFETFSTYRDPIFQTLVSSREGVDEARGHLQWTT